MFFARVFAMAVAILVPWTGFGIAGALAQQAAILSGKDIHHPVFAANGMVASQEAQATRAGVEILRRGGNAVDAAVTVGFMLAVTLPKAGNLGGGGFMMVHDAKSGATRAIDYREMAPAAASRDIFLDAQGNVDKKKARFSRWSAGVPGTVAGLWLAHRKFGSRPWRALLAPAIRAAGDGIVVTPGLARSLKRRKKRLQRNAASRAVFYKPDGGLYRAGEILRQTDLAKTLRLIAEHGAKAFYQGEIAMAIARDMKKHGGPMTLADLKNYLAKDRAPVTGDYRGYRIAAMPPPSSGGVHLVQLLNIAEGYDLKKSGHNSAASIHFLVEAMKYAYADRSQHLGDPDFWQVPQKGLTSKAYAQKLRALIDPARARPSAEIKAGQPAAYESNETTHFSIQDSFGNAVSNTYTLNFSYGSGIMVAGTGILLNNEMDDFSAKPGTPNAYGLLGGEANAIAPAKRPLSSMTPTLVFKDGKPWLATGTPGGSRIITTVFQVLLNVIDHDMNIAAATVAPRFHHQWLPDYIRIEPGLSPDSLKLLAALGHKIKQRWAMGSVQSVMRVKGGFLGASDPRRPGALTSGF